ncbi:MAG: aminopeptidase [Ruminococcaceae bacterium]|nr:aminopeptidase [Oscillospiraceae bacterium]
MSENKNDFSVMKEELFYTPKHASKVLTADEVAAADAYCEGYKNFLNDAKTEREAVCVSVAEAEKNGFVPYEFGKKYNAGDKVYYNNRGKSIIFAIIGKRSLADGVRIAAAHIDSPRLDLKPNPMYEDNEIALLKTHYYGGIKKYQWTAIPLALHGVVVKKDGTVVTVCIGEDENDPKFVISDLLPHLAQEQSKRTLADGIRGEELNVIIGSRPFADCDEAEAVKLNILKLLNEKYGIIEADFLSAELEVVPAFKACDIGLDRALIGSYGHDDRVCAYPALTAILETENPEYTVLSVLTDKEETGSDGNTGLNSSYMADFITDLAETNGVPGRICMKNSECLSADVNAAFDPTFADVLERRNAAYLNKGIVITKYTGSRGKGGTSDASAEFMGRVRSMLDKNGVIWQIGELGKVDLGGGGTVAKYVASHNIDVIDAGVPVISMHAPFEVVSKIDVYMAHRAFKVFFAD